MMMMMYKLKVGSVQEGGFAAYDDRAFWSQVPIPVLLITSASAERLKRLMNMKEVPIPKLGLQNVTILDGETQDL